MPITPALEGQISVHHERAERKTRTSSDQLSLFRDLLKKAADAGVLEEDATRTLLNESQKLAVLARTLR